MAKMNGAGYATVNINVLYVAMVYGGKECIGVCSFFFCLFLRSSFYHSAL